MKRWLALFIVLVSLLILSTGCSESDIQTQLNQSQANYETLLADKNKLKSEYDELKAKHDKLVADTADWQKLTDEQKATQLAQAHLPHPLCKIISI